MNTEKQAVNVEAYITTQLRKHTPVVDSPTEVGATVGASCFGAIVGLFYFLPQLYSWIAIGTPWHMMEGPICFSVLAVFAGAALGMIAFWGFAKTVARRQYSFDGANSGFQTGFLIGAAVEGIVIFGHYWDGSLSTIDDVWTQYSGETCWWAIFAGSILAIFGGLIGGIVYHPRTLKSSVTPPHFHDREGEVRELNVSELESVNSQSYLIEPRKQFGSCIQISNATPSDF